MTSRSVLFTTSACEELELRIKSFLNEQEQFLSAATIASPRATGDAIQGILSAHFQSLAGEPHCVSYSSEFARRAMADLAFEDSDGFYYVVDVKTHRTSTAFNMPNLISVERLTRFYESDKSYFVILYVGYDVEGLRVVVTDVKLVPIEFLDWSCLTIGALGWGQIQIANASRITVVRGASRKRWMLQLCDALARFYPREIEKIQARIDHFRAVRERWDARPD